MDAKDHFKRKTVQRQLLELQSLELPQLTEKWRALFGHEPPGYGVVFMRRRLAHRIQELMYGAVSEETMRRISRINTKISRSNSGLRRGTQIKRVWNGAEYLVTVTDGGYEYDGQIFKTLSAVAKKITGAHWNGNRFFGFNKEVKRG